MNALEYSFLFTPDSLEKLLRTTPGRSGKCEIKRQDLFLLTSLSNSALGFRVRIQEIPSKMLASQCQMVKHPLVTQPCGPRESEKHIGNILQDARCRNSQAKCQVWPDGPADKNCNTQIQILKTYCMCCSSDLNTSEIRNSNNLSALTAKHDGELICIKLIVEMSQVAATPQQFANLLPRKSWEKTMPLSCNNLIRFLVKESTSS